jgi:putative hemolysin
MLPKRINFTLALIILLAFSLAACAKGTEQPAKEEPSTGMANPASVYCQGLGFKEETRENDLGQYGVCLFPDGTECDTWDFLAGRCGQEHSYCVKEGNELKAIEDSNIADCTFKDGSTCSEFLYFQGDCKPGDNLP